MGFERNIIAIALAISFACSARAETLVFHGSLSGKPTYDQGEGGGNPFATALIELLGQPSVKLSEFSRALKELTAIKSLQYQTADVPHKVAAANWFLVPQRVGERRVALVLIVSDYSRLGRRGSALSLPGARHDAKRIGDALTRAGFATDVALDLDLKAMKEKLTVFKNTSKQYDSAIIYTTGHGTEIDGKIFLLPTDYPIDAGTSALAKRAVPLNDIVDSAQAGKVNLIFYGGCREKMPQLPN